VPSIEVPAELLERLRTVADHDYEGASTEQALDRLLREHQEYVMLEAAGELYRRATGEQNPPAERHRD
jgi:hypothetical protein